MGLPNRRWSCLLVLAAALAGCASTPPSATVQVFTPPPAVAAGTTYRHERLPSQAGLPLQAEIEAAADAQLTSAGLRRSDGAGRLALQVTARQEAVPGGWGWGGPTLGVGVGGGGSRAGVGIGLGIPIGGGVRQAQRVDVQLRDVATGQVVWQSQASAGAGASPGALVRAALAGFPHVGAGTRQERLDAVVVR